MDNEEKNVEQNKEPNELEKFISENQAFFDKWKSINEAVEEEMEEIARHKAEHPELYETEYQVKVTNQFIEENPDVQHVVIDDEGK